MPSASLRRRALRRAAPAALVVAVAGCGVFGDDPPPEERAATKLTECLGVQQAGQPLEAVACHREVLAIEPGNKFAHYNIALIDQLAGREAEAEAGYRIVLSFDPLYAPALFNLAILRTGADPNEAVELYRQVIALQPDNADAHLNLGFLLREPLCRADEADGAFREAVRLNPEHAPRIPEAMSKACGTGERG